MKRAVYILMISVLLLAMVPAASAKAVTFEFYAIDTIARSSVNNPMQQIGLRLPARGNSIYDLEIGDYVCPNVYLASASSPAHGTLDLNGGSSGVCGSGGYEIDFYATYYPDASFAGEDSFDFYVSDGVFTDVGLVTIVVNTLPIATNGSVSTSGWWTGYYSIPIAADPDGDNLLVGGFIQPEAKYGTIDLYYSYVYCEEFEDNCHLQFYWYAPTDPTSLPPETSFTFGYGLTDSYDASNLATVTMLIGGPDADDFASLAANNMDTVLILQGYDNNSTELSFTIVDPPTHGVIVSGPTVLDVCPFDAPAPPMSAPKSGTEKVEEFLFVGFEPRQIMTESTIQAGPYFCATVVYRGATGYVGEDSFTFVTNDGVLDSVPATVRLYVQENLAPIADNLILPVNSTDPIDFIATGSDPNVVTIEHDGWTEFFTDHLTLVIDSYPSLGTLENFNEFNCYSVGNGQYCQIALRYIPPVTTFKTDSFTFHMSDGSIDSPLATVTIIPRSRLKTLLVNTADDEVDSTCSSSHCSLREAIETSIPGDTIQFNLPLPNTISLTKGMLLIDNSVQIQGPGADQLAISAGEKASVVEVFGGYDTVVNDYRPISVGISGLSFIDGRFEAGGGLLVGPMVTLLMEDSVIGPNNIVTYAGGGLFGQMGDITLNRCTVAGNHGTGSEGGAGIFVGEGSLTLINSTVANNVTNNYGGGIYLVASSLSLINSTISGNLANENFMVEPWGGAGGIYVGYADPANTLTFQNSIVAGNFDLSIPQDAGHPKWPDLNGSISSLGGNLIGDITGSEGSTYDKTDLQGSADAPIDPLLGPVALNGPGTTPTMALLEGSLAIDTAPLCVVEIDQRGLTRPQGAACDIGAYEVGQYQKMKVDSIALSYKAGRTNTLTSLVTITDGSGLPVDKALVTGHWSRLDGGILLAESDPIITTSRLGIAKFTLRGMPSGSYEFCVMNVAKDGWYYASDENILTCASITVP